MLLSYVKFKTKYKAVRTPKKGNLIAEYFR